MAVVARRTGRTEPAPGVSREGPDVTTDQELHPGPATVAVAAAAAVLAVAAEATQRARSSLPPVLGTLLRPRLPAVPLHPERWVGPVARGGGALRSTLRAGLSRPLDALVPAVLSEVLRRAELTDLVLRYLDIDRVVAAADLDAAAARIDLAAIIDRIDLIGLAEEIIDGVDLPAIIRESTGSMASDTVRSVRMQGIVADEAIGRAFDRLLLRRGVASARAEGVAGDRDERDAPASP